MGFGPTTTADDVLDSIDLSGRTVLVTGASTGLGKETARALASRGAQVIMAARNPQKCHQAIRDIRSLSPDALLEPASLDLASLASVRRFAELFLEAYDELDLLVANAGVMASPFGRTADGFEEQFGTNHLGHFVLVNRLVPALLRSTPSRVVLVSSAAHQLSDVDLTDPNFERTPYDKFVAYGRSKTANVLFAVELDRRLRDWGLRSFALHPGAIHTELGRHVDAADLAEMAKVAARTNGSPIAMKSIPEGAATGVWAATAQELDGRGGLYLEDCAIAEVQRSPALSGVRDYAVDPERALQLWQLSERLVGEIFSW